MATTIFRRDHLMRDVVTPGTTAKDHLGRLTTSTADHMGRALVAEVWADGHPVTVGEYLQITASGIVYRVTANGSTGTGAPTPPGVGSTVVSGTATLMQITTA